MNVYSFFYLNYTENIKFEAKDTASQGKDMREHLRDHAENDLTRRGLSCYSQPPTVFTETDKRTIAAGFLTRYVQFLLENFSYGKRT